MKRLAAIALIAGACSSPSPDTAITTATTFPETHPRSIEMFAERAEQLNRTTTTEVHVHAAAVTTQPPRRQFTGDIPALIRAIWPDDSEEMAVRVAWCESRFNPSARNPNSSARGLFQMLWSYHAWRFDGHWYDPAVNTRAALSLYQESGWNGWRASAHCWGGR